MHHFREQIEAYIRTNALPVDKYEHQPRLYRLAIHIAQQEQLTIDDDILHAAVWLHDIGVFEGHRPEDKDALAHWDNVKYACELVPQLLKAWLFPTEKISPVIHCIEQHLPNIKPDSLEATILRDADILEMMGSIALLRQISKVGRDTRYPRHSDILPTLEQCFQLQKSLTYKTSRRLAEKKAAVIKVFLDGYHAESFY